MSTGETPSMLPAKEALAQLDKILDEYESKHGLPTAAPKTEAEKYLTMSVDDLRHLNQEDTAYGAVALSLYGFHLQKLYNKEVSRFNWADASIRRAITSEVGQYRAASADERKALAIKNNAYASKLEEIKINAQARIDRLAYIATKVELVAERYKELQYVKNKQGKV